MVEYKAVEKQVQYLNHKEQHAAKHSSIQALGLAKFA